jgi:putative alpha-1,2-mannosidase
MVRGANGYLVKHPADAKKYAARALSYKNIFDKEKAGFALKRRTVNWKAWPDSGRMTQWYGTFETNPTSRDGLYRMMWVVW